MQDKTWVPISKQSYVRCACGNCENQFAVTASSLITLSTDEPSKFVSVVLPDDTRLCKLDHAAQPLDNPDSEGWWAFDGEFVQHPGHNLKYVLEVVEENKTLYAVIGFDLESFDQFKGKWYKINLPWED